MDGDRLQLTMPATGPYTRLARVAVTGLATRLGFSFDEVEDLRLAVAEVCTRAIEGTKGSAIEVAFIVGDRRLDIDVSVRNGSSTTTIELGELADQIVEATVDDVTYLADERTIRITKSVSDED